MESAKLEFTEPFETSKVLPQGSGTSQTLFKIWLEDSLKTKKKCLLHLIFCTRLERLKLRDKDEKDVRGWTRNKFGQNEVSENK